MADPTNKVNPSSKMNFIIEAKSMYYIANFYHIDEGSLQYAGDQCKTSSILGDAGKNGANAL